MAPCDQFNDVYISSYSSICFYRSCFIITRNKHRRFNNFWYWAPFCGLSSNARHATRKQSLGHTILLNAGDCWYRFNICHFWLHVSLSTFRISCIALNDEKRGICTRDCDNLLHFRTYVLPLTRNLYFRTIWPLCCWPSTTIPPVCQCDCHRMEIRPWKAGQISSREYRRTIPKASILLSEIHTHDLNLGSSSYRIREWIFKPVESTVVGINNRLDDDALPNIDRYWRPFRW